MPSKWRCLCLPGPLEVSRRRPEARGSVGEARRSIFKVCQAHAPINVSDPNPAWIRLQFVHIVFFLMFGRPLVSASPTLRCESQEPELGECVPTQIGPISADCSGVLHEPKPGQSVRHGCLVPLSASAMALEVSLVRASYECTVGPRPDVPKSLKKLCGNCSGKL